MRYYSVPAWHFNAHLHNAALSRGQKGLSVSKAEGDGVRCYLADDSKSGFAMDYNGNVQNVFSHASVNGRLPEMIALAEQIAKGRGLGQITLDCFDGLGRVYARHGFVETGRVKFDWEYAPAGWTKDMGEPDVVFMAKTLHMRDNPAHAVAAE